MNNPNNPASHYQVHAVMTSGSTRFIPFGTIPRYQQYPGIGVTDQVNLATKHPDGPKVTPAFDEDDDAAFPHAIMGNSSNTPPATPGLRRRDDGKTVKAPAARSAVGSQMDMRELGREERLTGMGTGMQTNRHQAPSNEEDEDVTMEHPRRRQGTSLADPFSKRSLADSVFDPSLASPPASFSGGFDLGTPGFDIDLGNEDQYRPIKKRRMAMHVRSASPDERSFCDDEERQSLRDMSVDEPRNDKVKQLKKSDLAEKKKSNPRARLFTGTHRCRGCIDTVRVQRECWAIPGVRARCAPCAKAGGRCSFMETPPNGKTPPKGQLSDQEEEEDSRPRQRSRSIAHGREPSSKPSALACHLEGYASTLDTLREVLKDLGESQAALPGYDERIFALSFVEKKLQKVSNEMRGKGQEILELEEESGGE